MSGVAGDFLPIVHNSFAVDEEANLDLRASRLEAEIADWHPPEGSCFTSSPRSTIRPPSLQQETEGDSR